VVQPGFERPDEVLTLRLTIPEAEIDEETAVIRTYETIIDRLSRIPGVESVGASTSIPMDSHRNTVPIFVEEFPLPADQLPPLRRFKMVTGDYFSTMVNPVLAGRAIDWSDIHNRANVAVITENLALEYWDDPSRAIGKRLRQTPRSPWREIIGVVGDIRDDGVGLNPTRTVFYPNAVADFWDEDFVVRRSMAYVIRTPNRSPESIIPEVRQAVRSVSSNLPLARVRTLKEILDQSMARTSFALVMLGIAAAAAILLGVVGVYGVISYGVVRRTPEIGLRMALGAGHAHVIRMVLKQGAMIAAIGTVSGLVSAASLTTFLTSLLFGVSSTDLLTYILAGAGVAAVSLLATFIPARRAAAVNPIEALHCE
jgi:predicted permease